MTIRDTILEEFYKTIPNKPVSKNDTSLCSFDRNIYYYDRDEVARQAELAECTPEKITYEDHRKAIETAVNMMRKDSQHDIAMNILTHRFFKNYRARAFRGNGSFTEDYSFLITKIAMVFNYTTGTVNRINLPSSLKSYTEPTLVQINHITGTVTEVNVPGNKFTLNEWQSKFSAQANESTTYRLVGITGS